MAKVDIVIIGGCGHVGLPLGLAFARVGKKVAALDIDADLVARTNRGEMPFQDRGADELLPRVLADKTFFCTTDPSVIGDAEIIISVVGTPVDEHLNPEFHLMQNLILDHREHMRKGQLYILRSTVYPGTTARAREILQKNGLELDFAFCPERVAQGYALEEIESLPQIVAGCTDQAQKRAEELFRLVTSDVIRLSPMGAELAKLFTNSWRYIQFAVANQFYMIANDHGINFEEIHAAMVEKYPRAEGFPRQGFAAGPCLLKDTVQLSAFHTNNFFVGHSAMLINEGLPSYLVDRLSRRYELQDMTAGILGMTFKADCDDTRDSLSFKLRKILQGKCQGVLCHDPHVRSSGMSSLEEVREGSDILFIGVPHSAFHGMDFGSTPVVDVWGIIPNRMSVV